MTVLSMQIIKPKENEANIDESEGLFCLLTRRSDTDFATVSF